MSLVALGAACSSKGQATFPGGQGGATSEGTTTGTTVTVGGNGGSTADGLETIGGAGVGGSTGGNGACNSGANDDNDHDGFTPAQGDCNDCDPNVNPGAVEVIATADADGGIPTAVDEDCDGKIDNVLPLCDTGLALTDTNANDAVKAIDLCQVATTSNKVWGVLAAKYVGANGTDARTPGTQVGLRSGFGTNVTPRLGKSMLGLSSGFMRTPGESGYQTYNNKVDESWSNYTDGHAPSGFPQAVPNCPVATDIHDDIALDVTLRAPTNATGYKFQFKFQSFEYPEWVCTNYNDQFIALVSPAPAGSIHGNISFDSKSNPVSVNIAFFDVCDPSASKLFAGECNAAQKEYPDPNVTCPTAPSPYCPSGIADLVGTGLDGVSPSPDAGATSWLQTTAPVTGGSTFHIRFAIWDTGDDAYDSSVLIDGFQWIANGGTVTVATGKPPS